MAFNQDSTALEVIEGHDLTGYNVIVTGSNSGIGVETVRAFAKAGANCFMTCRNPEKAKPIADEIIESTDNKNVHLMKLELDSLESVNSFVKEYLEKDIPLNILVNNAGVMACPLTYTRDGIEMQFGTNHIGHFALTVGLLQCLKKAASQPGAKKSRVVNVASLAHAKSDVDFEDYNFKSKEYDAWDAYGQSKTANILFSVGLTKRYASEGIFSNALMPGAIMTNLQRNLSADMVDGIKKTYKTKTVPGGASTTVWAAVAEELEGKGGLYLEDCQLGKEVNSTEEIYKNMHGFMSFAINESSAEKLWDLSEKLIKKE